MTDLQWEHLSNQAIGAAGVVYFLALLSHLVEWSALRTVPVKATRGPPYPPDRRRRRSRRDVRTRPETRARRTRRPVSGSTCSAGWP